MFGKNVVVSLLLAFLPVAQPVLTQDRVAQAGTNSYPNGGSSLLERPAGLQVDGVPLRVALTQLSYATGVALAFSPSLLPERKLVTCDCRGETLGNTLERLLAGTDLRYSVLGDQIVVEKDPQPLPTLAPPRHWRTVPLVAASLDRAELSPPSRMRASLQQGVVAGVVIDARSLQPLAAAQLVAVGTGGGGLTDLQGRFRIEGIPGDEVTLRVTRVGYRTIEERVAVGRTDLRLALSETAIELDAVVVTGTAGGTRRRALGNVVTRVNADELQSTAPTTDMKDLLNARAVGSTIQPASGEAGAGVRIRVRGGTSLSLGNEPLLYVDGVRVDNAANQGFGGTRATSRINDIDPNTIESIEVIKGPAAATLYGTEASNGVIQIITKRGTPGPPQITFDITQGSSAVSRPEARHPTGYQRLEDGTLRELNLVRRESERGTPMFRTAHMQRYGAAVSGGSAETQYFLSVGYLDEGGVVAPNRLQRFNMGADLRTTLRDNLLLSVNGAYVSSLNEASHFDVMRTALLPAPALIDTPTRGGWRAPPTAFAEAYTFFEDVSRFTGGVQLAYTPVHWLRSNLTVGVDDFIEEANTIVPLLPEEIGQFFGRDALGLKEIEQRDVTMTTVDYSATANLNLTEAIGSSTSVGAQYYRRFVKSASLVGRIFPAPGVTTVSSAADRRVEESSLENITFGIFAQQEFSWHDRLFLSAGIRADDNSAFGRDFNLVTYPKVSGAWVISEERFWSVPKVSTLRLRAAYGESGQQPEAFAALTTFEPVPGPGGVAGVRPQFPGNPDLGPERGKEIEVGFEAGLFEERLGIDFTYFDKRTEDAIVNRPRPPSSGFPGLQFVNLGEVKNQGFELQLNGTPLMRESTRLDVSFSLSWNESEITDMGDLDQIQVSANQFHRAGFPVGSFFAKVVVSADADNATGQVTNIMCDAGVDGSRRQGGPPIPCEEAPELFFGQTVPKWEGAVTGNLTLFDRLTLSTLVDFKLGHRVWGNNILGHCHARRNCRVNAFPEEDPVAAGETALSPLTFGPFGVPDVSFTKLRQVSLRYLLPDAWRGPFSRAEVTVSARNLYTWTDFWHPEPEGGFTTSNFRGNQGMVPFPLQFQTRIRVTL